PTTVPTPLRIDLQTRRSPRLSGHGREPDIPLCTPPRPRDQEERRERGRAGRSERAAGGSGRPGVCSRVGGAARGPGRQAARPPSGG
ncbi:hypothetical protein FNH09_45280, partial [Streptomyces adustus]|nr:hypothetical protein [Streptomyces adustus]